MENQDGTYAGKQNSLLRKIDLHQVWLGQMPCKLCLCELRISLELLSAHRNSLQSKLTQYLLSISYSMQDVFIFHIAYFSCQLLDLSNLNCVTSSGLLTYTKGRSSAISVMYVCSKS